MTTAQQLFAANFPTLIRDGLVKFPDPVSPEGQPPRFKSTPARKDVSHRPLPRCEACGAKSPHGNLCDKCLGACEGLTPGGPAPLLSAELLLAP
jgi:hypothetical protein